jgi:hypothetical protein
MPTASEPGVIRPDSLAVPGGACRHFMHAHALSRRRRPSMAALRSTSRAEARDSTCCGRVGRSLSTITRGSTSLQNQRTRPLRTRNALACQEAEVSHSRSRATLSRVTPACPRLLCAGVKCPQAIRHATLATEIESSRAASSCDTHSLSEHVTGGFSHLFMRREYEPVGTLLSYISVSGFLDIWNLQVPESGGNAHSSQSFRVLPT